MRPEPAGPKKAARLKGSLDALRALGDPDGGTLATQAWAEVRRAAESIADPTRRAAVLHHPQEHVALRALSAP